MQRVWALDRREDELVGLIHTPSQQCTILGMVAEIPWGKREKKT